MENQGVSTSSPPPPNPALASVRDSSTTHIPICWKGDVPSSLRLIIHQSRFLGDHSTAPSSLTHSAALSGLPALTLQAEGKARTKHLQVQGLHGLVLWPARNMSFHWTTVTPCRTRMAPRSGAQPEFPTLPSACEQFPVTDLERPSQPAGQAPSPHLHPLLLPPPPSQAVYLHSVSLGCSPVPLLPAQAPTPRRLTACVQGSQQWRLDKARVQ